MSRPSRIIKIFEWLWIAAGTIAIIMAIIKTFVDNSDPVYGYYLFFISVLCFFLAFIKRRSRRMIEKKYEQQHISRKSDNSQS